MSAKRTKNFTFWRLWGGSGETPGDTGEAPWRLLGIPGRPYWGRLGDILEASEAIPGRPGAPDGGNRA